MTIRIGGVPYGVGAPLLAGLDTDSRVEFVRETPARLIEGLREGRLDAALASSVEGFRRPGYRIAPGLCIASNGPARSVRAFMKPGTTPKTVGVDWGSESSVVLLKILLNRDLKRDLNRDVSLSDLEFERIEPTTTPDALPQDVVLLIGDAGLSADPGARETMDLGEQWQQWTGLPFVYAVWLIAPGRDPAEIVPVLADARRRALAADVTDGTEGAIYYDLGDDELAGLARFHSEAAELGLVDPAIEPVVVVVPDADRQAHP